MLKIEQLSCLLEHNSASLNCLDKLITLTQNFNFIKTIYPSEEEDITRFKRRNYIKVIIKIRNILVKILTY